MIVRHVATFRRGDGVYNPSRGTVALNGTNPARSCSSLWRTAMVETLSIDRTGGSRALPVAEQKDLTSARAKAKASGGFLWIGFEDPDESDLGPVGDAFALHPLAVQDALTGKQQPKIQTYADHLFVVMWAMYRGPRSKNDKVGELFLWLGDNILITVQRNFGKQPLNIPEIFESQETVLKEGALGALYGVMTHVANSYSDQASDIEEELEKLEAQVFDRQTEEDSQRVYRLRLRIGKLKRAVSSLAAAWAKSEQHLSDLTVDHANLGPYVSDLLDDLTGTSQLVIDQGDAIQGLLTTHENNVAAKQNVDTRKISAIAALLSVPAVFAGLAGMNFKNLPGITWQFGWEALLVAVVGIDAFIFVLFRRRGWL